MGLYRLMSRAVIKITQFGLLGVWYIRHRD